MPSPAMTATRYVLPMHLPPLCGGRLERIAACCHCERSEAIPRRIATPDGDCFVAPLLSMTGVKWSGSYLFMFQMSVASCHWPPILRHTTTYLPVTSFGGCAFVLQ